MVKMLQFLGLRRHLDETAVKGEQSLYFLSKVNQICIVIYIRKLFNKERIIMPLGPSSRSLGQKIMIHWI